MKRGGGIRQAARRAAEQAVRVAASAAQRRGVGAVAGAAGSAGVAASGEPIEPLSEEELRARREEILRRVPVPTFWLLGLTGSGKSSIVRFLTGADAAEVGEGFRPCTRHSARYEFPEPDEPLLRFLDTRGLGEASYDPSEDLAAFDEEAHAVIVVARAGDPAQSAVLEPLARIRRARRDRPVVLVVTCLHQLTGGEEHPDPDPWPAGDASPGSFAVPAGVDPRVGAAVADQVARFGDLVDHVVPVDLTPEHEGFAEPDFGGRRLMDTLARVLPDACRESFRRYEDGRREFRGLHEQQAMPHVLAAASMAAGAASLPVPLVDIPMVLGIQLRMLSRIAAVYGERLDPRAAAGMMGGVAGRLAMRMAVRGLVKVIPFIGPAANAAMAWAWTYGLGRAACWAYARRAAGHEPTPEEIERVWGERMREAVGRWRPGGGSGSGSGSGGGA